MVAKLSFLKHNNTLHSEDWESWYHFLLHVNYTAIYKPVKKSSGDVRCAQGVSNAMINSNFWTTRITESQWYGQIGHAMENIFHEFIGLKKEV